MSVINCSECGKVFFKTSGTICPSCLEKEEEYEKIVIDYVRDHPKVTAKVVCKETGIKERIVVKLLQSGRLVGTEISYPCKKCGETIFTGSYCNKCNRQMQEELEKARESIKKSPQGAGSADKERKGAGMYSRK
jgi:hypothetical protein